MPKLKEGGIFLGNQDMVRVDVLGNLECEDALTTQTGTYVLGPATQYEFDSQACVSLLSFP
jgi:hypothetical protein